MVLIVLPDQWHYIGDDGNLIIVMSRQSVTIKHIMVSEKLKPYFTYYNCRADVG
jgi:hypothetical protein